VKIQEVVIKQPKTEHTLIIIVFMV